MVDTPGRGRGLMDFTLVNGLVDCSGPGELLANLVSPAVDVLPEKNGRVF